MRQKVSVRTLVEFVLRQGDLQSGGAGTSSRAIEGTRAHQFIQKARGADYLKEVSLSTTVADEEILLEIHGRADGVIIKETGVCIEEIKSTTLGLEQIDESYSSMHWAQAQCYAYLLAEQEDVRSRIEVQLTYVQLHTHETKVFTRVFDIDELKELFLNLVQRYLAWARRLSHWVEARNESIRALDFPYPRYRTGQRELVVAVYKTMKEGKKLFVQAPTGIGKTLGTIFPALKGLNEGFAAPIFYLTAKTITRTVAETTLAILQNQGLAIKRLTLTAKDKICFCPEIFCTPEECTFAKGYYERVRFALEEIFAEDSWDRGTIERYAKTHSVCPFEFSLDLAIWADFIICDYNYVFDPRVYLKRFFQEGGEYLFLVDEAHNLVDRAREMFSAELKKEEILRLKRDVQKDESTLAKRLQTVNNYFLKLRQQGLTVEKEAPVSLYPSLEKFVTEAEKVLKKLAEGTLFGGFSPDWKEPLLELYFKVLGFLRTAETYDEHYVTHYQEAEQDFTIKLFCVDPSRQLAAALERGRAAVFFSATLSPLEYFIQILGGEASSYKLRLKSPFPPENLNVLVHHSISTKYKQRASTFDQVVEAISAVVRAKTGNYLVYFPSYDYLQEVYERFSVQNPEITALSQTPGMKEEEREEFLERFREDPKETLVGFAVLGGLFGEGVDLTGSRLSGAVIVGVGLPQIGPEREIIRSYFEVTRGQGFEFAYMYPGMHKVLQAVGRVIRTEEDRGVVLLIDERFSLASYRKLFPKEWDPVRYVGSSESILSLLKEFWAREGYLIKPIIKHLKSN